MKKDQSAEYFNQRRRSETFQANRKNRGPKQFNYALDFGTTDFRKSPELYRVGRSEEGVLLVQPYKSEILPYWKFKTPSIARVSAAAITKRFEKYRRDEDFVGMDMARKYLQMGFTRSRRYANHAGGKKYDHRGRVLPFANDREKAAAAEIFWDAWQKTETDPVYATLKQIWKLSFG